MDVICERCNTEYEFDETLLSARGTSVKCTNCGHVFKVYPRSSDQGIAPSSTWRLKRPDGTFDAIDSLRELQRRISSGELTPSDEIARGEDGWKKLGSIPELETFFQAAGVQIPSARIRSPIPPAPVGRQEVARESSVPSGRRPRQPTLLGVSPIQSPEPESGAAPGTASGRAPGTASGTVPETEVGAAPEAGRGSEAGPGSGAVRGSRPQSVPESASEPALDFGAPSEPAEPGLESLRDSFEGIEDAQFEERPRAQGRSTPPPAYFDDDDDIPELPARGWSPVNWLLLIVLVGGVALVFAQWERVASLVGMGSDPALIAAGITEGDASLALATPEAYDQAIEAYRRAVEAGGDQDPELLARLSNAYALAAQARLDDGTTGEAVQGLQAEALTTSQRATALDPRSTEAKLAEADALRLASELGQARTILEEARAMSFSRTAEAFRVEARLSAAEAGGDLAQGLPSAKQAVALAPNEIRYALLLARAERAAGNQARAKEALESLLAEHPGHPVAAKLLAEVESAAGTGAEAAAGTEAVAGPAAGSEAEEPASGTVSAVVTEPEPAAGAERASAPGPATEPDEKEPATPRKKAGAAEEAPAKPSATAPASARLKKSGGAAQTAKKKPQYDEYDQLSKAAQSDAFVDGRPPVRDYEWQMSRGWDELAAGNYTRARAFFDSALEVSPGSADAMDGLGRVAAATEDYASALRYFRVAAERGHPDGYFELGRTYERLGRDEEAVSAYYTYIKRNPTGSHAAAARAAIKNLEPRAKLPPEPEPDSSAAPSEPTQESGPALP